MLPKRYVRLPVEVSEFLGGGVGVGRTGVMMPPVVSMPRVRGVTSMRSTLAKVLLWSPERIEP